MEIPLSTTSSNNIHSNTSKHSLACYLRTLLNLGKRFHLNWLLYIPKVQKKCKRSPKSLLLLADTTVFVEYVYTYFVLIIIPCIQIHRKLCEGTKEKLKYDFSMIFFWRSVMYFLEWCSILFSSRCRWRQSIMQHGWTTMHIYTQKVREKILKYSLTFEDFTGIESFVWTFFSLTNTFIQLWFKNKLLHLRYRFINAYYVTMVHGYNGTAALNNSIPRYFDA